jgi:hypothetical protein
MDAHDVDALCRTAPLIELRQVLIDLLGEVSVATNGLHGCGRLIVPR